MVFGHFLKEETPLTRTSADIGLASLKSFLIVAIFSENRISFCSIPCLVRALTTFMLTRIPPGRQKPLFVRFIEASKNDSYEIHLEKTNFILAQKTNKVNTLVDKNQDS